MAFWREHLPATLGPRILMLDAVGAQSGESAEEGAAGIGEIEDALGFGADVGDGEELGFQVVGGALPAFLQVEGEQGAVHQGEETNL